MQDSPAALVIRREGTSRMGFLDKAKDLLAQNADTVGSAIDKAGEFVDSKTDGKYKDTVSKVQEAAKNALNDDEKGEQQS